MIYFLRSEKSKIDIRPFINARTIPHSDADVDEHQTNSIVSSSVGTDIPNRRVFCFSQIWFLTVVRCFLRISWSREINKSPSASVKTLSS